VQGIRRLGPHESVTWLPIGEPVEPANSN